MKGGSWVLITAISGGAVLGALLRFWTQRLLNSSMTAPLGTLLVNVAGSFVLGIFVSALKDRISPSLFDAITAGFCGSLTTFSAIAMESFQMFRIGEPIRASIYVFLTLMTGVGSFMVGQWIGNKVCES
ncbi:MAG: CrcB family protein [Bacteroidia bacterium]|nr:CrcB family protein [Bacteroidia bacterium]MDW8134129.1 CrcB family protein [Bacteroidia bacterium]